MARGRKKNKAAKRRLVSWTLAQLYRLAGFLHAEGRDLEPDAWLKVGANLLSSAPAGKEELTRAAPARWGLDHASLLIFATRCKLDCRADDIARHVTETTRWRRSETERTGRPHHVAMKPDTIGALLGIDDDDRRAARAWNVGTVNGSPEARKEAARARDRERKQRARREAGAMTREQYLSKSQSSARPWLSQGVSRRTYERRKKNAVDSAAAPVASPSVASPSETNKGTVASPSGTNIINPDTAGAGYALPARQHPEKQPITESLDTAAARLRRRKTFEPVEPCTRADIAPGGLAARALEMALRNPPARDRFRRARTASEIDRAQE